MVVEAIERGLARMRLSGRSILVAASGGIDSTVLLHALASLRAGSDRAVVVGHVHHGLRGDEADADEAAVRAQSDALGLAFGSERVEPGALRVGRSNRDRPTWQEAARTVRYQALRRIAESLRADHVATAHTLDDQAETVLMRLLRGTAPDGLGGIPEQSADGVMVRPLLAVSRTEIEAYAVEHGLAWREDASNQCDRYTRNRLRNHWLPGLARDFNPQLLRAIGRLAEAQRRDAEWIEQIVDDVVDRVARDERDGTVALASDGWSELPEALGGRVVGRLLARAGAGRDLTRTHVERAFAFLRRGLREDGPRTLELPGGLRILATHQGFTIRRIASDARSERSEKD